MARERHVQVERSRVERPTRVSQAALEPPLQRDDGRRHRRGPDPGDPRPAKAADTVEKDVAAGRRDAVAEHPQRFDRRARRGAEEGQRRVEVRRHHRTPARLQRHGAGEPGERRGERLVDRQAEEEPRGPRHVLSCHAASLARARRSLPAARGARRGPGAST